MIIRIRNRQTGNWLSGGSTWGSAELRYSEQSISEDDIAAVVSVLRADWLTQGPAVEAFEAALCEYTGAKYAIAVSSGTAALHLAYLAAHKHRLLTSPLSFVATANAALLAGMDVLFHDVDQATGNVALPEFTDCLPVPVHFAGRAAAIPASGVVIEDAAHAIGAICACGCGKVGNCAHSLAACFSFHPVKPITTGEGGAVTTNDQGFADEVRLLRSHGRRDGQMVKLGLNYRMTDFQAALGLSQLKRCDEMRERRRELALWYSDKLMALDVYATATFRGAPTRRPLSDELMSIRDVRFLEDRAQEDIDSWHLFPIRIKGGKRDAVKAALNARGIGAQVHYSPPIHLHPYYRERFGYHEGMFPEAEAWATEELSLPLHSKMTEADVTRVVEALREVLA